ncbi:hypothetical protein EG329_002412, partial [Mollisiaceae sp. DMI_Dod_QoI]
ASLPTKHLADQPGHDPILSSIAARKKKIAVGLPAFDDICPPAIAGSAGFEAVNGQPAGSPLTVGKKRRILTTPRQFIGAGPGLQISDLMLTLSQK